MPSLAPLAAVVVAASAALGHGASRVQVDSRWATLNRADAIEISVDTVAYHQTADSSYRFPLRLQYLWRTERNAALWDMGARRLVLDEEVSCGGHGRPVELRTHWVRVEDEAGATVGDQRGPGEWAPPPPGSIGASYGRAVCRLLPRLLGERRASGR